MFAVIKDVTKTATMITNQEEYLVKSMPINRIIAWQRTTQFSVDSELNVVDLYFSGVYLKRKNNDLIIIDADAGNIKRRFGLARFISKFLMNRPTFPALCKKLLESIQSDILHLNVLTYSFCQVVLFP